MKKYILIYLSFICLLNLSSCDEILDINDDPFVASSADPNALLPYVFVQYSARKVSELGSRICDVSQYISITFNSPADGAVPTFLTGNVWSMVYTQVLSNLALVKSDAEKAGITSNNINAIATILGAHIFYEATSLWEDVPFSEAIDGTNFPTPKFDKQEDVLFGIVDMYDQAINLIENMPADENFDVTTGDMYYGGDMNSWMILANSLKLRALMMLKSGGADVDTQIDECLKNPLMSANSEAAYLNYSGEPGAENAMFKIITAFFGPDNESQNVFGPGTPIDNLLRESGDPRYDLWIARNDKPAPEFFVQPNNSTSVLSNNIIRGNLPDVLMLPSEIDFYKAQLALEGFSSAGSVELNYKNGIRNAIAWWGKDIPGVIETVSDADITSYINSLAPPTINDIYNQQYLSSFMMPVLAWNQIRINKVPVLMLPPSSNITTILKRFDYPPDEAGSNPNTPVNKNTDEPMWFENL